MYLFIPLSFQGVPVVETDVSNITNNGNDSSYAVSATPDPHAPRPLTQPDIPVLYPVYSAGLGTLRIHVSRRTLLFLYSKEFHGT